MSLPRLLPVAAFLILTSSLTAADWPQWRGLNRDNVWSESGLPEQFPVGGLKPRWQQPIGGGYSGIAVSKGRVYTLDRRTEPREVERVLCLDVRDGKTLWSYEYPVDYGKMQYGNGPRSTPTIHGDRVYTLGARGHLHCLEAGTGKVVWNRDAEKQFHARTPTWGHACSPLVDGERVIVQIGGMPEACLIALDRTTGKEIWRSLADRPGYSSPVLIETKAGRQLVIWSAQHLNGINPANGKVLWQIAHTTSFDVTITDPVWHDGVLLVSDYWEGSKAVKLDEQGRNPSTLWDGRRLSQLMCTPLLRDGYSYSLDRSNGLKCIDVRTGAVKWEGYHITPRGRNPQMTMVWMGKRALALNSAGELVLAELTPDGHREISRATILPKGTWANPAFADRCVFARNDEEIICVPLVEEK